MVLLILIANTLLVLATLVLGALLAKLEGISVDINLFDILAMKFVSIDNDLESLVDSLDSKSLFDSLELLACLLASLDFIYLI